MTQTLKSYLKDAWVTGAGGADSPIHDPTTEEVVGNSNTNGLDFALSRISSFT